MCETNRTMFRPKLMTPIIGLLLLSYSVQGATHKGRCLDHTEYAASAHCATSDQTFEEVSVKFDRDSVTVYFDDGGHLSLKLDSEEITDLHDIRAHTTDKGYEEVTWILDLSHWEESSPASQEEPGY